MPCRAVSLPMHLAVPVGIWPFCGACREDGMAAPGSMAATVLQGTRLICGLSAERAVYYLGGSGTAGLAPTSAEALQELSQLPAARAHPVPPPCSQLGESTHGWHPASSRGLYWVVIEVPSNPSHSVIRCCFSISFSLRIGILL